MLAVIDAWHMHTSWFGSLITLKNDLCLFFACLYLDLDADVAAAAAVAAALHVLQDTNGHEELKSSALSSLRRAPSTKTLVTVARDNPGANASTSSSTSPVTVFLTVEATTCPTQPAGTSPAAAKIHSGAPASRRVDAPPPRKGPVVKSRGFTGKHSSHRNSNDGYGFRSGG